MSGILWMDPVFKEMIWGGSKLKEVYGYNIPSDKTGECWALSAHKNGDCVISEGEFVGKKLSELWNDHRELFGNLEGDQFPLLVKIIDANNDLSVQVHPDDEYAKEHENSLGKEECWYVLGADEGTKMVMGHHAKTKEELVEAIENDNYDSLLNAFPVKEGDFFTIPTGTIHAICSGSLIYEAQQSSDITYRVYDYHRVDDKGNERELHVRQSIDVTNVPYVSTAGDDLKAESIENGTKTHMTTTKYFQVDKYDLTGVTTVKNDMPFMMVSVVSGEGTLEGKAVKAGSHCIVCADKKEFVLDGTMTVMVCTI
ncbi:type I phosphomannose isomerase catalytic subunit [Tannockella kyphosi]|uniref:type I phosphomannose isomerase catalytic subunit n=1 Tax=Tannockella kyphosi TaxID=2899121 RepID=UPI0020119DA6|nr:type I phosphomannose isomerase catalytic subunit [Tannockella kyphosi]